MRVANVPLPPPRRWEGPDATIEVHQDGAEYVARLSDWAYPGCYARGRTATGVLATMRAQLADVGLSPARIAVRWV